MSATEGTALSITACVALGVVLIVAGWANAKVRQAEAEVRHLQAEIREQGLDARHHARLARLWYRIAVQAGQVEPNLAAMVEKLDPELSP